MPVYDVLQGNQAITITATTVLGFQPGQSEPCPYIFANPAGGITITLPLSTATISSSTGGNYYPGTGEGYTIQVINLSTQTLTFAAATGDTLVNNATNTTQYQGTKWIADPANNHWIKYT